MANSRKKTSSKARKKSNDADLGGFTIIEVVLVLAIAGLIFLMVFIALPALQRAQRDTQRRDDIAKVSEAITQYQTNNNGRLPNFTSGSKVDAQDGAYGLPTCASKVTDSVGCFIVHYLNSSTATQNEFVDPDGWTYGLTFYTGSGAASAFNTAKPKLDFKDHMIYVIQHSKCDGEAVVSSNNARDHAVVYKLEGSGTYCQDNL